MLGKYLHVLRPSDMSSHVAKVDEDLKLLTGIREVRGWLVVGGWWLCHQGVTEDLELLTGFQEVRGWLVGGGWWVGHKVSPRTSSC